MHFRWRFIKTTLAPLIWCVFVVYTTLKMVKTVYKRTEDPLLPKKSMNMQSIGNSQWSLLRRGLGKQDVYLEELKQIAKKGFERQNQTLSMQLVRGKDEHESNGNVISIHYFNKPEFVSQTAFVGCPDKCYLTWGENEDISSKNAVIFQTPLLGVLRPKPPPKPRGQVWVFHGSEAPVYYAGTSSLRNWRNLFNWTMNYRRDADIRHSYGEFKIKQNRALIEDQFAEQVITNLSNPVSWFVSHCSTSSKRELYVRELSKYITTDIYGKCGIFLCDFSAFKECIIKYKFYLSFESAFCRDYITEKAFKIHQESAHTIPVVRGLRGDYSLFLPPGSYVNVDNFFSPEQLADYLLRIARNATMFQMFFQWKRFYESFPPRNGPFCELCKKLHKANLYKRLYSDIESWITGGQDTTCVIPKDTQV